ncbi:MAG TPA: T9SS type A sorting domain-containing protein [Cytophagaceae bacterium]
MKKLPRITLVIFLTVIYLNKGFATDFYVTNTTTDNWSGAQPNGSFAKAIADLNADATAGPHRIIFQVSGTIVGGNPANYFISKNNVTLDGITSAPGASCGNPVVIFDGPGYNQFAISGNNVTIDGLIIQDWRLLVTGTGFKLYNCIFGSDGTSKVGGGNGYYVRLEEAHNSIIGANDCSRNVFGGHGSITNAIEVSGSNDVDIIGNYFGTNKAGTTLIENFSGSGINISSALNLDIKNNVINGGYTNKGAIEIASGTNSNLTIESNYVGINASGLYATSAAGNYGNSGHGIAFLGGSANNAKVINNVVSCNAMNGITIHIANSGYEIRNNIVGLKADGIQGVGEDYGNGYSGIRCFSATATATNLLIDNNIVCKNSKNDRSNTFQAEACGIIMNQNPINSVTISNNYVGVDKNLTPAGNSFTGIYLFGNGSMGGGDKSKVLITNNIIGDNGETVGTALNSHGIAVYSAQNFTIRDNFVGIGPGGEDIGNSANGIELNSNANNFTISGNRISYNKGRRTSSEAEACGGILIFSSTNGYIQNNIISNQANAGGSFVGNNGIVVQKGGQILIGGTAANEPNVINNNGTHGIFILEGADYVQITQNKIYCNTQMGISLNIAGDPGTVASKSAGNSSYAAPGPTLTLTAGCDPDVGGTVTLSGTAPTGSIVEIFNSPQACRDCPSIGGRRGEGQSYLYQTTAVAGAWSYGPVSLNGDVSVTATGTGGTDCTNGFCRTSRFSDCEFCSLPLEWINFTGLWKDNQVSLQWQTHVEKNVSHFIVYKSIDGSNFEEIGIVEAVGNTHNITTYYFNDENPIEGINYYKIKEVDIDGRFDFSTTIHLLANPSQLFLLSPNPSDGIVNIKMNNIGEGYHIKITNALGVVVETIEKKPSSSSYEGSLNIIKDLSHLPKGMYMVTVSTEEYIETRRLILE